MILSILICHLPERFVMYELLMQRLARQLSEIDSWHKVEILTDDSTELTTGAKRNRLMERATGEWVTAIDDDDEVSQCYIEKILEALKENPDCVGISGTITVNGVNEKQWHISKEYGSWYETNGVYYRTTNHISPVRRSIAIEHPFPDRTVGEDYLQAMSMLPDLKTEVIVEGNIYFYRNRTHNKNEPY